MSKTPRRARAGARTRTAPLTEAALHDSLRHLLVLVQAGLLEADRSRGLHGKRLAVLRRMMKTGKVDIAAMRETLNYRPTKLGREVAMAAIGLTLDVEAGAVRIVPMKAKAKR